MQAKVQKISEFFVTKHSQIFTDKLALVRENCLKVLQMQAGRLGLTAEDLAEFSRVLDIWAGDFAVKAKAQLTEALNSFVSSLALGDYLELLEQASEAQSAIDKSVRHSGKVNVDKSSADGLAASIFEFNGLVQEIAVLEMRLLFKKAT